MGPIQKKYRILLLMIQSKWIVILSRLPTIECELRITSIIFNYYSSKAFSIHYLKSILQFSMDNGIIINKITCTILNYIGSTLKSIRKKTSHKFYLFCFKNDVCMGSVRKKIKQTKFLLIYHVMMVYLRLLFI